LIERDSHFRPRCRGAGAALVLASAFCLVPATQVYAGLEAEQLFDCVIEPHALIKLGSPVAGVIDEVMVDRSDLVKENQVVVSLESSVEEATVALSRRRAEADGVIGARQAAEEYGKRAVERQAELYSQEALSQQMMDEAELESLVSSALLQQAMDDQNIEELELNRSRSALERRSIRSPINGIVVGRMVQPGERVDEAPILELAQVDPLSVEVILPTEFFGQITPGMTVSVMPEEPIGGVRSAEVVIVDRIIDTASGTFRVRADLPNPELALPGGLRCQVRFDLQATLPASAQ